MANLFRIDSPLTRVLNRAVDLVLLNLIFLVTCLPVVTVGASVTALYAVTLRMARREDGALFTAYFRSWRANFRQATALWLAELAAWAVLWVDQRLCAQLDGGARTAALLALTVLSAIAGLSTLFVFPILARFQGSARNMLANSLLIPLSGIPCALVVAAITVGPLVLALLYARVFLFWMYLLVMGGVALTAYANSFFLNRLFVPFERPYLPAESSESEPKEL